MTSPATLPALPVPASVPVPVAMLMRQFLLCTLAANFWWKLAPSNRDSFAANRGMFYDAAALRALAALSDADADQIRSEYHTFYVNLGSMRDTYILRMLKLQFIFV